jgi:hypothetical protein
MIIVMGECTDPLVENSIELIGTILAVVGSDDIDSLERDRREILLLMSLDDSLR